MTDTTLENTQIGPATPLPIPTATLPNPQTSPTEPTGVATSSLADQTLSTQKSGTYALAQSVDNHAANKAANGGTILGYRPDISIVDLLTSKGQPSDYATRAKMAFDAGIKDYTGTADQNKQLIGWVNTNGGKTGTTTTGGSTGTQGGTTDTNGTQPLTEQQQYVKSTSDATDKYQNNVDQHIKDIDAIANGTFPLTPDQQATIDATKVALDETRQMQLKANESYENSVALAGNRLGTNIQNPAEYAAEKQQAISDDIKKIRNLDAGAAKVLADLKQGFMDKDYKYINDKYTALQDALTKKQEAIDKLHKDTLDQARDLRDYNEKVSEFEQTKKLEYAKLNQPSYTLKDNADGTQTLLNTKTGVTKIISGADAATAANSTPGNTGVSIIDGNTKRTSNGVPYIDGSSLTGKTAESAQQAAALHGGIPFLGANESGAMDKLSAARSNLYDISNNIQGLLPKDATGRLLGGALNNKLSRYFQTNEEKASFNTWRSAAIGVLQSLAGGAGSGLRINQAEIALSVANDIPNITDTAAVAQAKIAKVTAMMNNQEHALLGGNWYDKYNPDYAIKDLDMFASSSPEHALQITAIHLKDPSLTPYQVLQIAQP